MLILQFWPNRSLGATPTPVCVGPFIRTSVRPCSHPSVGQGYRRLPHLMPNRNTYPSSSFHRANNSFSFVFLFVELSQLQQQQNQQPLCLDPPGTGSSPTEFSRQYDIHRFSLFFIVFIRLSFLYHINEGSKGSRSHCHLPPPAHQR